MPTQKQRQERLEILAEKWKTNEENGCSEVLNRFDFSAKFLFVGVVFVLAYYIHTHIH